MSSYEEVVDFFEHTTSLNSAQDPSNMVITTHMFHKMIQEEKGEKSNEFEEIENPLNSSSRRLIKVRK